MHYRQNELRSFTQPTYMGNSPCDKHNIPTQGPMPSTSVPAPGTTPMQQPTRPPGMTIPTPEPMPGTTPPTPGTTAPQTTQIPIPTLPLSPGGFTPGQVPYDFFTTPPPTPSTGQPAPIPGQREGTMDMSRSRLLVKPTDIPLPETLIPGTCISPVVIPSPPNFTVPSNPLLPEEYTEIISYENLQFMNCFLRTQIGKLCSVEFLIGTSGLATE